MNEKEKELNNSNENAVNDANDNIVEEVVNEKTDNASNEDVANENETSVDENNQDNINESSADDSKEVKYENNDNWEFEAKAPTLDSEIELSSEYELNIPESKENEKKSDESDKKDDQIVINKKSLKIVLTTVLSTVIVVLLVVLGVFFFTTPNSKEIMNPGNVAMKIGKTNISVGMYNYYYKGVVSNYEQYAQNGYIDLDVNSDYSKQYTEDKDGNKISWLDLFKEDTKSQLQYVIAFYEAGVADGIKLTEKQQESINKEINNIEKQASEAKVSVEDFMEENYGKKFGIETLRKTREQFYIANEYYNQRFIKEEVKDDEFETYFNENKNKYYSTKFACVEMIFDAKDKDSVEKSKELAKKYCSEVKDVKSLKAIIPTASKELIKKYVENGYFETEEEAIKALEDSIEMTKSGAEIENNFGKDISNWLMSSETAVGSTNYYVDEEYGFIYIFLKTGEPVFDETEVYSVRHILVTPKSAEKTENAENPEPTQKKEYTDEEWKAALDSANAILEEYNSGDKTEASFAVLAEAKSDDIESTSLGSRGFYGGAIEGAHLGEMVPEFEKWATDDTRKYGDVDIVKSQFGYHIMFFMNDGPVYNFNALRDFKIEKYADVEKEFIDACEVKERRGMKKTQINETKNEKVSETNK